MVVESRIFATVLGNVGPTDVINNVSSDEALVEEERMGVDVGSRILAVVLGGLGPTDVINDVTSDAVDDVNREEGLAVTVLSWLVGDVDMEVLIVLDLFGTIKVGGSKLGELDEP